jgi:hypothetical protein
MHVPKKQFMRSNVKREHLRSIRDKFDDLCVSVSFDMKQQNTERLLKALTVYILQGGTTAPEDWLVDDE